IAEAVNADADKMVRDARIINPRIDVLKMSLKTGKGFDKWIGFLKKSKNRTNKRINCLIG
ncbi:MAG: hypothetical protein WA130_10615, partial [Candidatus Methanoperedens sp.]